MKQTTRMVFCEVDEPHKELVQETWKCSYFIVHLQ